MIRLLGIGLYSLNAIDEDQVLTYARDALESKHSRTVNFGSYFYGDLFCDDS